MNEAEQQRIEPYGLCVVAVDGPAGSGKSSICKNVSEKLGWPYVSTGKLYRSIGLLAKERGVSSEDTQSLLELTKEFCEVFVWDPSEDRFFIGERDLTPDLYSEEVGALASKIAKVAEFRTQLLDVQRKLIHFAKGGILVDGRDVGSVVFPDAQVKIFLTASLRKRAERRAKQLVDTDSGNVKSIEQLMEDIEARDRQDQGRSAAPLVRVVDAELVDTTSLNMEEAVSTVMSIITDKCNHHR